MKNSVVVLLIVVFAVLVLSFLFNSFVPILVFSGLIDPCRYYCLPDSSANGGKIDEQGYQPFTL